MSGSAKSAFLKLLGASIAITPWLLSMYLLYWLESSGTWTAETAHRGKISVAILAAGMGVSFLLLSKISGRKQN